MKSMKIGMKSMLKIMKILEMDIGVQSINFYLEGDAMGIKYVEHSLIDAAKEACSSIKTSKKGNEENYLNVEGQLYDHGISLVVCEIRYDPEEKTGMLRKACSDFVHLVQPVQRVNTTERLEALRSLMKNEVGLVYKSIKAYIITSTDEHQSIEIEEYEKRLRYISGFSGSYGDAVVTEAAAALWTDGRYHLQADEELNCDWLLFKEGHRNIPKMSDWLKQNLPKGSYIGVYSKVISEHKWNKLTQELKGSNFTLVGFNKSLIDDIWSKRPEKQHKSSFVLDLSLAGKDYVQKVNETRKKIGEAGADAMVITSLDEIAWLLNIRGRDIPFSQFIRSYAILDSSNIFLYVNSSQLDENTKTYIHATGGIPDENSITLKDYAAIWADLKQRTQIYNRILVPSHCAYSEGASHAIYDHIIPSRRLPRQSPIIYLKAVKNAGERRIMKRVNIRDAAAVCDCFAYMENKIEVNEEVVNEENLAEYLDQYRYEQNKSYGNSFRTKAAFGFNAAYPRYEPTSATNAKIFPNSTVVLESGGQYYGGTTVITRTLHFGTPTSEMINAYTRVLIGLIQLSSLKFPSHMKMAVADSLARASLWEVGLDYEQDTGHGVGAFLGTHESPIKIRFDSGTSMQQVFKPGYFLSSAPGYYSEGEFGVRLENMMEVVHSPYQSFLEFETITFVPFEPKLININLLSNQHRRWLNDYNRNVRQLVGDELKKQRRMNGFYWMMEKTKYVPDQGNIAACRPLYIILSSTTLLVKMFIH